jgi:hypothetical protein
MSDGRGPSTEELFTDERSAGEIMRLATGHRELQARVPTGRDAILQRDVGVPFRGGQPPRADLAGLASAAELAGGHAQFTHDDVDDARHWLCRQNPLVTRDMVEQATLALTAGERDHESLIEATAQLAQMEPRDIQRLALASETATEPYGRVDYADPGYREGRKRYPVDTAAHVRAAWTYINQAGNAKFYTASQLAAIKSKIRAAAKRLGVTISSDNGGGEHHSSSGRASRGQRAADTAGSDSFSSGQDSQGGPSGGAGEGGGIMGAGDDAVGYYLALAAEESAFEPEGPVSPARFRNLPRVHDVSDDGDPTDSMAGEVARLLKRHKRTGLFGKESPYGSSASYGPYSPRARREEP